MATKKATPRKTPTRKSEPVRTRAANSGVPEGFRPLGGGYGESWNPEPGDILTGPITGAVREIEVKRGRKTVNTRVMEVTDSEGGRHTVWDCATLSPLFDEVQGMGADAVGVEVWMQFDGIGKKKPGQNPPKLFTAAIGT